MERPKPAIGPARIFWAAYPGERGDGKKRPMIVVSRRADLMKTGEVFAVVCSSSFEEPLQPLEVLFPFDPEGRCVTHLRAPTVAVRDWTTPFPLAEIRELNGFIPRDLLIEICEKAGVSYPSER